MTPEFRKPGSTPDSAPEADRPPVIPAPARAADDASMSAPNTAADSAARSDAAPAAPADPTAPAAPEPDLSAPPATAGSTPLRRSRFGVLWISSILAALVLILLLVFIIQNSAKVDISFLGAHGHLPLGVALLLSAVSGLLLVAIPGTGRILQLRRQVRRGLASGTGAGVGAGAAPESRRRHRS